MKPLQLSVESSATAVMAGEKADRDISPKDMGESDTVGAASILVQNSGPIDHNNLFNDFIFVSLGFNILNLTIYILLLKNIHKISNE